MFTAIDNVEARDRKCFGDRVSGQVSVVLPERDALDASTCLGCSERDCIGLLLVRTTVVMTNDEKQKRC
jgi:hypothetical protein